MARKELEYENTDARVKNFDSQSMLNEKFLRLMQEEFPETRYAGLILYSKFKNEKPAKHISLMYDSPADSRNSVLTIDCDDGEDFSKIMAVLKKL